MNASLNPAHPKPYLVWRWRRLTRLGSIVAVGAIATAMLTSPPYPAKAAEGEGRAVTTATSFFPSWTPNSQAILYTRQGADGDTLQRHRLDSTTSVTLLDIDVRAREAEMSPDGTRVVYTTDTEEGNELRVITLATGAITNVHANSGLADTRGADWSPDGSKLVFSGPGSTRTTSRLYVADADGTSPVVITPDEQDDHHLFPDWSPDGSTIAFTDWGGDEQTVKLIDADGTDQRVLATDAFDSTWSPGSDKLVVTTRDSLTNESRYQLRVVGADGSVIADLSSTYSDQQPAWSPDGKYLAFAREISGRSRIWVRPMGAAVPDPVAPSGPSVSINGGALYTNTPNVTLHVTAPETSPSVTVANDGGFIPSSTFATAPRIPWTLQSSGAERLPKTVYLRFDQAGPVFTDDIILDEVDPDISSATVGGVRTGSVSADSSTAQLVATDGETTHAAMRIQLTQVAATRIRTLRLRASDDKSGVLRLQANRVRSAKGATTLTYRTPVNIPAWRTTHVRVRDGAMNWTPWRRAVRR